MNETTADINVAAVTVVGCLTGPYLSLPPRRGANESSSKERCEPNVDHRRRPDKSRKAQTVTNPEADDRLVTPSNT
jgi:hypothetical protein